MDFEETDVLQCNLEYLTSTLEVCQEDGGGLGLGREGGEGEIKVVGRNLMMSERQL